MCSEISGTTFACPHGCEGAFLSAKALGQHMRAKHNIRSDIPLYIDDSGICPACGVNLHARAKVVTHACETRYRGKSCRVRCRDVILGGTIPQLPHDIFVQLQERDRKLIAAARRAGHTHVRTARPAKRVASASANRCAASSRKRGWECISSTPAPHAPPIVTADCNTNYDTRLLIPNKRLHVKSTIMPARPAKRLKVKTTLPCTNLPTS